MVSIQVALFTISFFIVVHASDSGTNSSTATKQPRAVPIFRYGEAFKLRGSVFTTPKAEIKHQEHVKSNQSNRDDNASGIRDVTKQDLYDELKLMRNERNFTFSFLAVAGFLMICNSFIMGWFYWSLRCIVRKYLNKMVARCVRKPPSYASAERHTQHGI